MTQANRARLVLERARSRCRSPRKIRARGMSVNSRERKATRIVDYFRAQLIPVELRATKSKRRRSFTVVESGKQSCRIEMARLQCIRVCTLVYITCMYFVSTEILLINVNRV